MSRMRLLYDRTSICKMPGAYSIWTTWALSQHWISSMVWPISEWWFPTMMSICSCRDMTRTETDVWTTKSLLRHWVHKTRTTTKCSLEGPVHIAASTHHARTTSSPTPPHSLSRIWCGPWSALRARKKPQDKACNAIRTSTPMRPSAYVTRTVMVWFPRTKLDVWWRAEATLSRTVRLVK